MERELLKLLASYPWLMLMHNTETGQLMTSYCQSGDKAWKYLRPSHSLEPFLRWEPMGQGIYELVFLDGWPSKVASNRPDGAYATKDLITPDPTIPSA